MTAVMTEREPKAERLEVRLTPSTKSILSHAAAIKHVTLTEFLVSSAVKAAEDVLVSPRLFEVRTNEGWRQLTELLDETSLAPDPALVSLLRDET